MRRASLPRYYHASSSESESSSNALFFLSNVMLPTFVSPIPLSETVLSISISIFSETFPSLPCLAAFMMVCSTPLAFSGFTSFTRASRSLADGSKIAAKNACRSSSLCSSNFCLSACSWREVGAFVKSAFAAAAAACALSCCSSCRGCREEEEEEEEEEDVSARCDSQTKRGEERNQRCIHCVYRTGSRKYNNRTA